MISIIIPIYNAEKYLKYCLESIKKQNYSDYEVLMIDDGSTDNSKNICKKYQLNDKKFRLIEKENGGSASARNLGLLNAQGDYIAFVDADDYIEYDYLSKLYHLINKYNADIAQCSFKKVFQYESCNKNKNGYKISTYSNKEVLEKFCEKQEYLSIAVLWNKLYKKELFQNLEFPVNKGIDDEYLICNIIDRAKSIVITDEILYYYYMSENSQMRSKPSLKQLDCIEAIEKQLDFFLCQGYDDLYNKLLYRYYRCIIWGYYYVKDFFPEEKKILSNLNKKRKKWYKVLFNKKIKVIDKIEIIVKYYFPNVFNFIHRKVRR